MAGKPQNRRELRRQYDAAEPPDPMEEESDEILDDPDDEVAEKKTKRKPKAVKPKGKSAKAAKPAARMRIVWTVMNDAFKAIATFDYADKAAAEAKAAEMTARGKGTHFVQKTKEAMPDNAPGLGAAIPRPAVEAPVAVAKIADSVVEDDEEEEEEDEIEDDIDDGDDE